MANRLTLELPDAPTSATKARQLCQVLLQQFNVNEDNQQELLLALGELCNNAILHGRSDRCVFTVEVEIFPSFVQIIVEDYGSGFTLEELEPVDIESLILAELDLPVSLSERPNWDGDIRIGGMGIFTVQGVMDELVYEKLDPGTRAIARKNVAYLENVLEV